MNDKALQDIVDVELERLGGGGAIAAAVFEGVVTLTGSVPDEMRRVLIEQELLRLPEILDVRNHLEVASPPGDARTRLLILLQREGVPCDGVEVAEADGAVILSGRAASWFDRDAAERLAWTLPGVQSVDNRITLPPEAVRPDADGAADPLA